MYILKAATLPTCLTHQLNRLVNFQLSSFTHFGFTAIQSLRRPHFLLGHPLGRLLWLILGEEEKNQYNYTLLILFGHFFVMPNYIPKRGPSQGRGVL